MTKNFSKTFSDFIRSIRNLKNNKTFSESLTRLLVLTRELKNPKYDFMKSASYLFYENRKILKINSKIYNEDSNIMEVTRQICSQTSLILRSAQELKEKIPPVLRRAFPLLNERSLLETETRNIFYLKNYRMRIRPILRQLIKETVPLMRTSQTLYEQSTSLRLITNQPYKKNMLIRIISRKLYEDSAHTLSVSSEIYKQSVILLIVCEIFLYRKWVRAIVVVLILVLGDNFLDWCIEKYGIEDPRADEPPALLEIYGTPKALLDWLVKTFDLADPIERRDKFPPPFEETIKLYWEPVRRDIKGIIWPKTKKYRSAKGGWGKGIWKFIKFFFTEKSL